MKKLGIILIAIVAVVGYAQWNLHAQYDKPVSPVTVAQVWPTPKPEITQDPTLMADARQLGIDVSELNLGLTTEFRPNFNVPNGSTVNAIFYAPNTINVRPGMEKTKELSSLAHEYLHYQWQKGNRASSDALMQVYNSNYYLRERMTPYNKLEVGSEDFLNELNSVECTEYNDSTLYYVVLNYCAKYVPNRNVLPSYFR